jgi:hypothetical protein
LPPAVEPDDDLITHGVASVERARVDEAFYRTISIHLPPMRK